MELHKYIVDEKMTILDTMKVINQNSSGVAFLCDGNKLLGIVSDGDIRRSIIQGISSSELITAIVNKKPLFLRWSERDQAEQLMQQNYITVMPIVDDSMNLINIRFLLKEDINTQELINVPVVIMAGGKGNRLKPYTDILPKPLIPVGEITIMEHIIRKFEVFGCNTFMTIVNYRKNLIKAYFSEKEEIKGLEFVDEKEFWGTGGGLTLLRGKINETFFMTNCDILVDADYGAILKKHREKKSILTIVCAKKRVVMPYGVVQVNEDDYIESFQEKPSFDFQTSTGLYLIEPEFLDRIKENIFINITDIIQICLENGDKIGTYLIEEENWMDMGQLEEYQKMKEKIGL